MEKDPLYFLWNGEDPVLQSERWLVQIRLKFWEFSYDDVLIALNYLMILIAPISTCSILLHLKTNVKKPSILSCKRSKRAHNYFLSPFQLINMNILKLVWVHFNGIGTIFSDWLEVGRWGSCHVWAVQRLP